MEQLSWRIEGHLLQAARNCPSPNCDQRPDSDDLSLLVIHGISLPPNQFGSSHIDELFLNQLDPHEDPYFATIQHLRVSTHLLIRRDGELVQYVPFDKRAWHAGVSSFEGRETCNDYSIGIELEGADDIAYSEEQYHQLIKVTKTLMAHYPKLTPHRIAGHCHIAPGRKTDPGGSFDWRRYYLGLKAQVPPHISDS